MKGRRRSYSGVFLSKSHRIRRKLPSGQKMYTDSQGRRRPITRRRLPPKVVFQLGPEHVKSAFRIVAASAPFCGQVCAAIEVASALGNIWDAYEKEQWIGVAKVVVDKVAMNYLSTEQSKIVWGLVRNKITPEHREMAAWVVGQVADRLTREEIGFVDRWLSQHR